MPSAEVNSRSYLGTEPLGPLMVRLAIPSIAAQVANLLYIMIDRILIGHVPEYGSDALAGLGVCMPVSAIVGAFAVLAAAGGAPLASMALGARDAEKAQHTTTQAQTMLAVFTIGLMTVGYLFMEPMVMLFGASAVTAPYAIAYLRIYLLGTVCVMVEMGMGMFLLAQGDSRQYLVATGVGAISHIALAAVFIFVFGWGIEGAAVASVISQVLCAAIVGYYLTRRSSALRLVARIERPDWPLVGRIISVGSGRFFIMFSEGVLLVVLYSALQRVGGDAYVSAMAILYSIQMVVCSLDQGFTQGTQPIMSYCYGAGDYVRAREAAKRIVVVSAVLTFGLVGIVMLFPEPVAALFSSDPALVAIAVNYTRTFFLAFLLFGVQLGMQSVFMGLGKGLCSLSVAAVRKVVVFIPLVFVLSETMGVDGVMLAEPISDFVSLTFCTLLFFRVVPKMFRK